MTIFDRVLCGVDGTSAGEAAAAVAARIVSASGLLELVSVAETDTAVHAGWAAPTVLDSIEAEARDALEHARTAVEPAHHADTALLAGHAATTLLDEIERRAASLAVVGAHGHSRAIGIAMGSVSTFLLHEAPCSVLIVREGVDATAWPTRIVVGVDGSEQSAAALAVARELAERFGASLRPVVATLDAGADVDEVRRLAPEVEELAGSAVGELANAAEHADLLVVGSRGLTGIRALGSVSERVAHAAHCPVLVVRSPQVERDHLR